MHITSRRTRDAQGALIGRSVRESVWVDRNFTKQSGSCQLDSKCSACRHHGRVLPGLVMSPLLRLVPVSFRCNCVAPGVPEQVIDAGESFIGAELLTAPLYRSKARPKDARFAQLAPHTSWLCTFGCSRFSILRNRGLPGGCE